MGKLKVNGDISATGTITASDGKFVMDSGTLTTVRSFSSGWQMGWAFNINNIQMGKFGFYGGTEKMNYFYVGAEYNNVWMTVSPDGTVTATKFVGSLNGNATSASSAPWSGITGKPSTFPPSSHTHNYLSWAIHASGTPDFNNITTTAWNSICVGNTNSPTTGNHGLLLSEMNVGTPFQIWYPDNTMQMWKRYKPSGSNWTSWSNTWEINITGSAATLSAVLPISLGGTGATTKRQACNNILSYGTVNGNFNDRIISGWYWTQLPSCTNTPLGDNVGAYGYLEVIDIFGSSSDVLQRWTNYYDGDTWVRNNTNGWKSWVRYLTSNNYSSYCLPLSGGTMTGRITLASTGFQTNNIAGYYLDQYGNFFHSRSSTGDHWQFHSYDQSISLKYYADTGDLLVPHIMKTQSITLTSTGAISFYGAGSGTYNCSMIYVDTTNGFQIETPRLTDSASGAILPCKILTRGGVPAPIHYSYAVSTNYGTGIPGTSTPGYGVTGAIYYKI